VRDAVVLNAAAGLAAHAGLTSDLTADLADGVRRAQDALDTGAAADVLDRWVALGRELAG
jgi:anthranilate phosphoribosyltransferase